MNEVTVADPSALTVHPAAALFPMLGDEELRELAEDIRVHGLASSIVVLGNMLLDGRNRLRACEIADVPPRFVEWGGAGSVTRWIFSMNLHRRHLSASQRAMLAARAVEVFAVEAKERMEGGVEVPPEERERVVAESPHVRRPALGWDTLATSCSWWQGYAAFVVAVMGLRSHPPASAGSP